MVLSLEDVRYLFSALIQALPTIISLSLIGVFALKPERNALRDCYRQLIFMILIFYLAIISNIVVLLNLNRYITSYFVITIGSIVLSIIAIIYLIIFLVWFIYQSHTGRWSSN